MRKLLLAAAIFVSIVLIFTPREYAFEAGMALLTLAIFLMAVINRKEGNRARWLFGAILVLLTGIFGSVALFFLEQNFQSAGVILLILLRVAAIVAGFIPAQVITAIFFVITAYVASIYLLALTTVEEITTWQALRSFIPLILNTQYDWIVIGNGKIIKQRPGGMLKMLGGPGKLIIEPGNAVILQRGGKFTRVLGAGNHLTERFENIRGIFDLRNQFHPHDLDNVMTADKVPLNIKFGVGYRIKRTENLDSKDVITDNENGFPVEKQTLFNADFNNAEAGWEGLGKFAPVAQLLDQISIRKLDDLFSPEGNPADREVKKIEDAIKTAVNSFAGNNGIEITVVDIQKILLPIEVQEAMAKATATRYKDEGRNRETTRFVAGLLDEFQNARSETELEMVTEFIRRMEIYRKLAEESDGKIVISAGGPSIETPIEMD